MTNRHWPRYQTDQRTGMAATELALALPLLVLIISGTLDLGRLIQTNLILGNAVRVGADYASTHRAFDDTVAEWQQEIRTHLLTEAANIRHFNPAVLTTSITRVIESDTHEIITVSARYTTPFHLFWISSGYQVPMTSTLTVRQFR